jgi:multidrug efflux system membrane fusion protein
LNKYRIHLMWMGVEIGIGVYCACHMEAKGSLHGAPGTYVYLVGADDTVSARAVDLGPLDGATFAVNAGLSPGDRVVVDGADRLREGAKVLVSAAGGSNGGGTARPADAVAPGKKRLPSQHPSEHGGHSGGPP